MQKALLTSCIDRPEDPSTFTHVPSSSEKGEPTTLPSQLLLQEFAQRDALVSTPASRTDRVGRQRPPGRGLCEETRSSLLPCPLSLLTGPPWSPPPAIAITTPSARTVWTATIPRRVGSQGLPEFAVRLWRSLPFASHLDLGHGINLKVLPSGRFKISFVDHVKLVFELLRRGL